jgi:hypothetical protein
MAGPDNRRLAYHEAGHAVIAYVVGARIDYVTIEPAVIAAAGATFGHTKTLDLDQGPADRLVLVGLAGSLAESREMGDADEWARMDERAHIERVLRMAKLRGQREGPSAITPEEEAAVSSYLEEYWPAVVAVASALLAAPKLDGEAVPDLVTGAVPPGGHSRPG